MHFLKSLELSQIIFFSDLCCRHILGRVCVLLRADQGEAPVRRLAEETGEHSVGGSQPGRSAHDRYWPYQVLTHTRKPSTSVYI